MEEISTVVLVIGAGPAGLATSACLNERGINNIVLEREDCCASLWKKRAYDRLKLHLAKEFCQLPHLPFPPRTRTFVKRNNFIGYLDNYAKTFRVNPSYYRIVRSASFDSKRKKWIVRAQNTDNGSKEIYSARFLVVATGENSEGIVPKIPGVDSFPGVSMHSSHYQNGRDFANKKVLVVGSGNSGMEIAYDLSDSGATTSITVRKPVHVLSKEMVFIGMKLLKHLPVNLVDKAVVRLSKLRHGNLAKYGLERPKLGPFLMKFLTGRSPVIDVGTIKKIKKGDIKVVRAGIKEIDGFSVKFTNGVREDFDAIVFATGYKSTVGRWLKDDSRLFNEDGMPGKKKPNHWKGEDGLYCAGFGRLGLFGISNDAMIIASNINSILRNERTDAPSKGKLN
ncbi:OLC1v1016526C1 [Oldenlandia corymbosa var. corymbosa]|uniref:Flavin-containing monooxygenase n=1 Tax=Oldenlandia corymbosa var. corymbosa TaxID=529605 RepID=A0AAV1E735_OLDCO|nr:OLC1v1016526C1 [Oldenlandia corymbosa var. corymbosa]